jgi:hypothetical protein
MDNGTVTGDGIRPQTPNVNGLSLTEYAANPSPSNEGPKTQESVVPAEFMLPNGTPDVRLFRMSMDQLTNLWAVFAPYPYVQSV